MDLLMHLTVRELQLPPCSGHYVADGPQPHGTTPIVEPGYGDCWGVPSHSRKAISPQVARNPSRHNGQNMRCLITLSSYLSNISGQNIIFFMLDELTLHGNICPHRYPCQRRNMYLTTDGALIILGGAAEFKFVIGAT
jgi:hypothetical protein